jgi:protein SCO1/2
MHRYVKRLLPSIITAAVLGTASLVWWVVQPAPSQPSPGVFPEPSATALPEFWPVPAFQFTNQKGERVDQSSLRGHVWIADFIYTTCTTACPIITSRLVLLQRALPQPGLRFVSFSVDPAHDTPQVLASYAKRWNAAESRWQLLQTTPEGVHAMSTGMKVTLDATSDAENPVVHTSRLFLIDEQGTVRGSYEANLDGDLAALLRDARTLLGSAPARAPDSASAVELYGTVGCSGCHDDPRLAPNLSSLAGARVELEGGASVVADAAYIRESLLTPHAKIVAGYVDSMPSYAGQLSDEQIDELVTAVLGKTLGTQPAPAGSSSGTLVTDPVCGMQVRTGAGAIEKEYEGKTYYFCSDVCRDRFEAHPDHYSKSTER